jgi:hypothetical protein
MIRCKMRYMVAALLTALTAAGCNEYKVETRVKGDGTGSRKMVFTMDPAQDEMAGRTPEMYARMFGIESGRGWRMETTADRAEYSDSVGKRVFTLESSIGSVDGWSSLDGSIAVRGTLEDSDYAGVFFTNTVSLETGNTPSGRSYTYREAFRWNGLVEAAVDYQADAYARRMKKDFPNLSEAAVAELRGMMAGHLLVGVRLLDIWNDDDAELEKVALSVGRAAEEIVAREGRGVAVDHVYELARIYVADEDSDLEPFLEKNLPGVMYAGLTEVKMVLFMPGRVVDTNGKVRDDGAVEWKMNLMDALGGAVEFRARSETQ